MEKQRQELRSSAEINGIDPETINIEIDDGKTLDRLKEPDVLIYIGKCFSSGMGYNAITKAVKRKYDITSSYHQVRKVVQIFQSRQSDLITGSNELQEMVKGVILDTKTQLEKLNEECWAIYEEQQDSGMKLVTMREILKQLEFQEKVLSRLSKQFGGNTQPKINKLEMTQVIVNSLEDLEKQGVIKILKNPVKMSNIGIESEILVDIDNDLEDAGLNVKSKEEQNENKK